MERKAIIQYKKRFDDIRHEENGIEFWYARELMELLEYAQWRNFEKTIEKAKISCENNGIIVADHFADVSKMVEIGSKAQRKLDDYMLTRYACYLRISMSVVLTMPDSQEYAQKVIRLYLEDIPPKK